MVNFTPLHITQFNNLADPGSVFKAIKLFQVMSPVVDIISILDYYTTDMTSLRIAIYYKEVSSGKEPAKEWLFSLKDKMGKAKIMNRISRAESGNFGDHRSVGEGVFELKIDFGPGYRVYYALDGQEIILLLLAGDKSSQSKDIEKSKFYWNQYLNLK